MIRASVSELKNRLSHYLRLVRGGEQIEIVDRKTPLARLIHVAHASADDSEAPWVKELEATGIVTPPKDPEFPAELLAKDALVSTRTNGSVLEALLEDRNKGMPHTAYR